MPHFLRHLCHGVLLAAALPVAAAWAGNVIYLTEPLQAGSETGDTLAVQPQGSALDVIQFGDRLTAKVHVQGEANHVLIQQSGFAHVVYAAQTGFNNRLVVSQGN